MALQEEFSDAKGGIPIGFLHVEYQLFRGDLADIMGKQKGEPQSTDAQSARYPPQTPSLTLRAYFPQERCTEEYVAMLCMPNISNA